MTRMHYFTIIFGFILIGLTGTLFVINEREVGVVFQFGRAVRVIENPGLNFKIPFIQTIKLFDKRILDVTVAEKELTASDGKRIVVDAFSKFRITDPVLFFKTAQSYHGINLRLNRILESSMRKVIGKFPLGTLLTDQRSKMMVSIKDLIAVEAKSFGIDVIDVRILKSDLPNENSNAIYRRMQTERAKLAKEIRAEGQEESDKIMSQADKDKQIILANAYMDSERIQGEGDSEAAKLYNEAYGKDTEFYTFYRSLISYKASLSGSNTSFVLTPDSEFFKYLKLKAKK